MADDTPCDDGDGCTLGDRCVRGKCSPVELRNCDDGNPCTVGDRCTEGSCEIQPSECACERDEDCDAHDDGDLCNGLLTCDLSQAPFVCVVDPTTVPECPAGDACKVSACEAGECRTEDTVCDDGNDCTRDECRPLAGCVRLPLAECAECQGLDCAACSRGADCAAQNDDGEPRYIDGTCCAAGDALVYLGRGRGSEVVDLETDGEFAYLCGGFGMTINDVRNAARPIGLGSVERRCQRMAIGPPLPGGGRVIYVAHHGDTWVTTPFLATYHRSEDGALGLVEKCEVPGVPFEGMVWHDGHLFSAIHGGGVRRYRTSEGGIPGQIDVIGGMENAWKLAVQGATSTSPTAKAA